MSGLWGIVVPEAGTNVILNPSAETTGNQTTVGVTPTITRDTTFARFGDYAWKIVPSGTNQGISLTTGALANAIHYVTFYARGNAANTLQVSLDAGSNYNAVSVIGGSTGAWVRYGVSIVAAQANGSTATLIRDTTNETFYVDGIQTEQQTYYTSYIDGDQGPLYRWSGLRHGSSSTRDAQDRSGGREQDFDTAYGIQVEMGSSRFGMPPIANNLQSMALQPGALFQSSKALPRQIDLIFDIPGTTLSNMHARRQSLINVIKPDAVRGAQPFTIWYSGANTARKMYATFRYLSGLELGPYKGFAEHPTVSLIAVDPFWYEDSVDTTSLTLQTTFSWVRGAGRLNGLWTAFGSGFNNTVFALAYDAQRGRIYFGGLFTTANGVTVNRVCYWNGTTFVAMDSGAGGEVDALCVMPNGDLYVGGKFTTIGTAATACKGLARWNIGTSTWTAITNTATTFTVVSALACDVNGQLFAGGVFTGYGGVANAKAAFYITVAGTITAMGTGVTGAGAAVNALLRDNDGTTIWVGGDFTTGNGVTVNYISKWNGTTFVALSTGGGAGLDNIVLSLAQTKSGLLYVGGQFLTNGAATITLSSIAAWNGTTWTALGAGAETSSHVYALAVGDDGVLYIGGDYSRIGPFNPYKGVAAWNGYVWVLYDLETSTSSPTIRAAIPVGSDLVLGGDTSGNVLIAAQTTVTPTATAAVFPLVTFKATTTAASQSTLQWLENQSNKQRLYLNLTINTGETITISFLPNKKLVISDWRGIITTQPLSNSDFAAWSLLPGANTISALVTGTATGALLLVHAQPRHWAADAPGV